MGCGPGGAAPTALPRVRWWMASDEPRTVLGDTSTVSSTNPAASSVHDRCIRRRTWLLSTIVTCHLWHHMTLVNTIPCVREYTVDACTSNTCFRGLDRLRSHHIPKPSVLYIDQAYAPRAYIWYVHDNNDNMLSDRKITVAVKRKVRWDYLFVCNRRSGTTSPHCRH